MAGAPDLIARGLGATDAELGLAAPVVFHLYIRDSDFLRVGELTDWVSFSFSPKFNDIGTWALETSADSIDAALLSKRGGIIVTRELGGVETTVFSGPVVTEWGYTGKTFRAAGYCDNYWLLEPARPNPELAEPPFTSDYHVLTNTASVVMRLLVAYNIGPLAPAARQIAPIGFPVDPLLGSTITSRANLQPLLTLLAELSITPYAGGLGFYLRQSDVIEGLIEFIVYAPPDRSADAKFSIDLGTIQDYEDMAEAPAGNRVYVMGGDGFGANRTIIYVEDDDSIAEWGNLPAITIDQRGTTDTGELEQKAAEAIAGVATLRRTAVTPFDVPSLQYGTDYDLGTLVTVVTSGGEVVDLVRQVEVNLDPERGAVITPIVGRGDGSDDERIATITRTIQDRMGNLERNWNVPDGSVTPAMLATIDAPADNELYVYDSATELGEWADLPTLAAGASFTTLTASGAIQGSRLISTVATGTAPLAVYSTTLVTNLNAEMVGGVSLAGLDSRYVDVAGDTMTGALVVRSNLTVQNALGTLTRLFVDGVNGRAVIGSATNLTGAVNDILNVVAGRSYFAANSEDSAIGLRYGPTTGNYTVGATNSATIPNLVFRDHGTSETFRLADHTDPYQATVTGNLHVTGVTLLDDALSTTRAVLGGTAFSGGEELRVVGQSRLEGDTTVTTGSLVVSSGTITLDANNQGIKTRDGGGVRDQLLMNASNILFLGNTSNTGTVVAGTYVQLQNGSGTVRFSIDATGIGVFGLAPSAQAGAYTQTYSTVTKTHANLTSATLTAAFGTSDGTVVDVGAAFSQTTLNNNFQDLATQINALRVDLVNLKGVVNAIIDDQQAYGWFQ